jgi:hypothetical protein
MSLPRLKSTTTNATLRGLAAVFYFGVGAGRGQLLSGTWLVRALRQARPIGGHVRPAPLSNVCYTQLARGAMIYGQQRPLASQVPHFLVSTLGAPLLLRAHLMWSLAQMAPAIAPHMTPNKGLDRTREE